MRRYLIVANQTLGGAHLAGSVRARMAEGPCSFHIIVPATRPTDHAVWTEGEANAIAKERLDKALGWFADNGFVASGEVGDARPMLAVLDALREGGFNEVIVSTLPPGMSKWLKQDLPARIARRTALPVTHVIGQPERVQASA